MFAVIALGLLSLASAVPAGKQYPEVVPGPGLPYLEELGLTSAELYQLHIPKTCDAVIVGEAANFNGASSHCRDVAHAVLWTIDSCTRPDQSCAGIQAAYGNGNLLVAAGTKYFYG